MNERVFILSGPSGVGKSSLISKIRERFPDVRLAVSATTRAPRPGEVDGVHYAFVARAAFEEGVRRGDFLEWAEVHGNLYGTPKRAVEPLAAQGLTVLLDIDVQGFRNVRRVRPETPAIFVAPTSASVLEERLLKRGSENPAGLAKRLENAQREMAAMGEYDHVVVNDDLERAALELEHLLGLRDSRTPPPQR